MAKQLPIEDVRFVKDGPLAGTSDVKNYLFRVAARGNKKEPESRVDTGLAHGLANHVLLQPASGGLRKEAGLSPVVVWVQHAGKDSPGKEESCINLKDPCSSATSIIRSLQ